MVSYADFMTLLFAFFTTMYATSNVDRAKLNSVVESMQKAFVNSQPAVRSGAQARIGAAGTIAPQAVEQPGADLQQQLKERLDQDLKDGRVSLDVDTRGVVISLRESGSFPVGSADLTPMARDVLSKVATTLVDLDATVRVEGHTDDVPIRTSRFASNWDLSTARAINVVQYLVGAGGLASSRLSVSGYGEFRPRVPNDSPENRAQNRRVDLVILNPGTRASEEPASTPPSPAETQSGPAH
jgi:chemotaxis protein MotB